MLMQKQPGLHLSSLAEIYIKSVWSFLSNPARRQTNTDKTFWQVGGNEIFKKFDINLTLINVAKQISKENAENGNNSRYRLCETLLTVTFKDNKEK